MRRRLRTLLAAAVAGSALATPASAAAIVVSFSATIDEVGSELASAFRLGESITASITIDTAVADWDTANPALGTYSGSITDLSLSGFGFAKAALEFDSSSSARRVAGNLDSLTVVPEPGSLALLGLGLISLAALARLNPGGAPRA
ncbi:MAG: PEP-CTERM sorting domain-containing protein [Candidatus Limnocylindria bacterium]|jgi:hypothetical protein